MALLGAEFAHKRLVEWIVVVPLIRAQGLAMTNAVLDARQHFRVGQGVLQAGGYATGRIDARDGLLKDAGDALVEVGKVKGTSALTHARDLILRGVGLSRIPRGIGGKALDGSRCLPKRTALLHLHWSTIGLEVVLLHMRGELRPHILREVRRARDPVLGAHVNRDAKVGDALEEVTRVEVAHRHVLRDAGMLAVQVFCYAGHRLGFGVQQVRCIRQLIASHKLLDAWVRVATKRHDIVSLTLVVEDFPNATSSKRIHKLARHTKTQERVLWRGVYEHRLVGEAERRWIGVAPQLQISGGR